MKWSVYGLIASILGVMLVGCAHHSLVQVTPLPSSLPERAPFSEPIPPLMPHSYTLMQQTLTLSTAQTVALRGDSKIELVSIADDGTTKIRIVETGKELSAHLGDFFDSAEFGSQGLQLISASKKIGAVSMISRYCISK